MSDRFTIEFKAKEPVTRQEDVNQLLNDFKEDVSVLAGCLYLLRNAKESQKKIDYKDKIIAILVKIRLQEPKNVSHVENIVKVKLSKMEEMLKRIEKLVIESIDLKNTEFIKKVDLALDQYTLFSKNFDSIVSNLKQYFSDKIKNKIPTD